MSESKKQIRPRVRKTTTNKSKAVTNDVTIEETRVRMESWMGLSPETKKRGEEQTTNIAPAESEFAASKPKPTSILKTPKYTKSIDSAATVTPAAPSPPPPKAKNKKPIICKDVIVERDPHQPPPKRKPKKRQPQNHHHAAVEGYLPTTAMSQSQVVSPVPSPSSTDAENKQDQLPASKSRGDTDKEEPLILNSMEELFQAAGKELPDNPTTVTTDAQLVEADISFSVMTQDQYDGKLAEIKREQQQDRDAQQKMFMGKEEIFGDEEDDEEESDSEEDAFLEMLMEQELEDDDDDHLEDVSEEQPRAFRKLWDALSDWITPEAVEWMRRLETPGDDESRTFSSNWTPQVDRSDVGASRCAGLMAMVKLYLPSSMRELKHSDDVRRTAEKRLGDLLRTFDYSREAPKLEVKLWKAMTCVLLDMVMIETRVDALESLPPSVQAVGMALEEYKYLTRSGVQTFGSTI